MAKTDRAAFLGELSRAENQMTTIFDQLAKDVGQVVLRAAGPDGTVPVERLADVQRQAHALVDAVFVGPGGKGFDEAHQAPGAHRPLSPYARVISEGQLAMIDLALGRQAAILRRVMPEDVRQGMAARDRRERVRVSPAMMR